MTDYKGPFRISEFGDIEDAKGEDLSKSEIVDMLNAHARQSAELDALKAKVKSIEAAAFIGMDSDRAICRIQAILKGAK